MNSNTCSRSWEVEAARDGRLSEAATLLLSEHLSRCEVCRREQRALSNLKDRLKKELPDEVDELRLRRLRREVLEQANRALIEHGTENESLPASNRRAGGQRSPSVLRMSEGRNIGASQSSAFRRRAILPMVAISLVAAMAVLGWKGLFGGQPSIQVTDGSGADWSEVRSPTAARVVLREGAIELRIRRTAGDAPMFVVVPDGEIEDIGTVFRVEVKHSATQNIEVTEGTVLFHRPGQPDVRVSAGEHWANPNASKTGSALVAPPLQSAAAEPQPPPPPSSSSAPKQGSPQGSQTPPEAMKDKPKTSGSGTTTAAEKPNAPPVKVDNLEEDIAYLRVIALLREGRKDEAKLAAKDYLRRFPKGFRRVEVEGIAR